MIHSWPDEVTRAWNRSKYSHHHQYELIVYNPIESIRQEGPQCGLVALAMAMRKRSSDISVVELFQKAKNLSLTIQGELFDARVFPQLCQSSRVDRWTKANELIEHLKSNRLCLVPYDADVNHEPCEKLGHRAHWLIASGVLKSSIDDKFDLILIQHGKSSHLAAFSLDELFSSNQQLFEIDLKRRPSTDYVLPSACGSLRQSLCGLIVVIDSTDIYR